MNPSLPRQTRRLSPQSGSTTRFAAAALVGCESRRCVWTHDFAPAPSTASGDVECCVVVGVPNEVTPATNKRRLGAPVPPVDMTTHTAGLRRVGRIDPDECDPRPLGLVSEELTGLGKCPRVQRGPLGLAEPYPFADPRQVLDSDPAPGAFSLGHDSLTDLMVHIGVEPRLLATAFLEQPACGRSVLRLQSPPDTLLSFAVAAQLRPAESVAIAGGRDVDYAAIDAKEPVQRLHCRCGGCVDAGMQKPHPVAMNQVRLADSCVTQHRQMAWIAHHSQVPQSPGDGPYRHRAVSADIAELPGQAASIERLRRVRLEYNGSGLDFPAPIRSPRSVVPGLQVGPQRSVCIDSLANHSDRRLGRQPEPLSEFSVEMLLNIEFAEQSAGMHLLGQPRRGSVAGMQGIGQCRRLFLRRQQPYLHHQLHDDHRTGAVRHRDGTQRPGMAHLPTAFRLAKKVMNAEVFADGSLGR